jgi:septum formation protein
MLASSSPRRAEILAHAGLRFQVVKPEVEERPPVPLSPLRLAQWVAGQKAAAVAARFSNAVVLGADTVVALDGRAFGKPRDQAEARGILQALSGRTHVVYTAVVVVDPSRRRPLRGFSRTLVTMCELSRGAIAAYVRGGEAQDKAGSYAIQGDGRRLVRAIRGPFDNVVGLPMHLVSRLLQDCGIPIPANNPDGAQHAEHHPTSRPSRRPVRGP